MAQKKKVTGMAGTVRNVRPPVPLGRGKKSPALLGQAPKTYAFRLEPVSKVHAPVSVWGYRTEHGWTGWLEERRTIQLHPTHWSKDQWIELPAALAHAKAK